MMESNSDYLAKIKSLRKTINERTLTSYPIFKNSMKLEEFLGRNKIKKNPNETIINFKDFDEKIKPNIVFKSKNEAFLRLGPCKKIEKQKSTNKNESVDATNNETNSNKPKIESILTAVGVAKKSTSNTNNNEFTSDSSSAFNVKYRHDKIASFNKNNANNKSFVTSIDGKKIDDSNHSQLVVESVPTSATLIRNEAATASDPATPNRLNSQNSNIVNFTLPKMTTQFPIRTTSPSLLANVNDILNRSSKMSNINSVTKIRKLLSLDDFSTNNEPSKKTQKQNGPKGHKLKSSLTLNRNEPKRTNSGLSYSNEQQSHLSNMLINTKIIKPNILMPIEHTNKLTYEILKKDEQLNSSSTEMQNSNNFVEKKSYTEFSFKVYITDRQSTICPPVTPNTPNDNANCLFCASNY